MSKSKSIEYLTILRPFFLNKRDSKATRITIEAAEAIPNRMSNLDMGVNDLSVKVVQSLTIKCTRKRAPMKSFAVILILYCFKLRSETVLVEDFVEGGVFICWGGVLIKVFNLLSIKMEITFSFKLEKIVLLSEFFFGLVLDTCSLKRRWSRPIFWKNEKSLLFWRKNIFER